MSTLYLPLRSNTSWFATEDTQAEFEQRLKSLVVTHDELLIQDGRYELTLWQDDQLMDTFVPLQMLGAQERTEVRFAKYGQRSSIALTRPGHTEFVPVVSGPISAAYQVDFVPLLRRVGIYGESYIRMMEGDLDNASCDRVRKKAREDARHDSFKSLPGGTRTQNEKLLEGLYIDAASSRALAMPFSADIQARSFAAWGVKRSVAHLGPDFRLPVYSRWVSLQLPDFSTATWSELHDLRESAAGRDFRRVLEVVSRKVADAASHTDDPREIESVIDREYYREVMEALSEKRSVKFRLSHAVAIDVLFNFLGLSLSASAAVAGATELLAVIRERNQWISLLNWKPASQRGSPLNLRD
jgi:hypothetical protein